MSINNIILIGFDRSGTSAISRTLAGHPDIELVFRPFNNGSIRKKMYEILSDSNVNDDDKRFFGDLAKGRFYAEYVVSEWHKKYSSIKDNFIPGKLHILITNLNHFTVEWIKEKFPLIENWAIWREPFDILQSCLDNNFYGDWYADALEKVKETIRQHSDLNNKFSQYIPLLDNITRKTAFLIAVRNYYLFQNIEKGKIINYEVFKKDPNECFSHFLRYFGIQDHYDFSPWLQKDLNSVQGKITYAVNNKKKYSFAENDKSFLQDVFSPLYEVFELKSK